MSVGWRRPAAIPMLVATIQSHETHRLTANQRVTLCISAVYLRKVMYL
jgi:hypothetical protein